MNQLDDCPPAVSARCPLDVAVLSRWFLEDGGASVEAGRADASAGEALGEEVAA